MDQRTRAIEESDFFTRDANGQRQLRPNVILDSYLQLTNLIINLLCMCGYFGFSIYILFIAPDLSLANRFIPICMSSIPLFFHAYFLYYIFFSRRFSAAPLFMQVFGLIMAILFGFPTIIGIPLFLSILMDSTQGMHLLYTSLYFGFNFMCFLIYAIIFYANGKLKHKLRKIRRDILTTDQTIRRLKEVV